MTGAHDSRLLIDGKLVDPVGGATFSNVNPYTEEVIGQVPDGSGADVAAAIAAARRAFDHTGWAADRALRRRCLEQLSDALEAEKEELRRELAEEVGCPVAISGCGPSREIVRLEAPPPAVLTAMSKPPRASAAEASACSVPASSVTSQA
jgi:hypothetical protein